MLELKNITKTFGEVVANDDVSISVKAGTIHAIVGENGAGKSTIMRIAYGFYAADSGEILFDGKPVKIKKPQDAIRLGIGMVHQHFMLVETMSVAENVILGAETGSIANLDLDKANDDIRKLSNELHLGLKPESLIEDLSVGQQQKVELLKALYRDADFLILDEPTAVLTPQEIEDFFEILNRMKRQGKTIVIITHKLDEVLAVSEEVSVMRDGKSVGFVKTSETSREDLAKLIVGREVILRVEKKDAQPKEPILAVYEYKIKSKHGLAVNDVSFDVHSGEIVGIAGVDGNGQTEIVEAIAGLIPTQDQSGIMNFEGVDISKISARGRKELGIGHIPEDRHKRGLLLDSDLSENSILGVHYRQPATTSIGLLDSSGIRKRTKEIINDFDVRPPNPDLTAKSLSGGNQQKLIIGREFELNPKLLLVSQPTRGVDIGAIEFIHRKLIELRDAGTAVLLVSSELEEVTALSDRLLVFNEGEIVGEVDPKKTSAEEIGLMMTVDKQK